MILQCPKCGFNEDLAANYCRMCGKELAYGVRFNLGIRFPEPEKISNWTQAVIKKVEQAPYNKVSLLDGMLYHYAFYNEEKIDELVELVSMSEKMYSGRNELIEHSKTGGKTWFTGNHQWVCFRNHIKDIKKNCPDYFFCCKWAEGRQHPFQWGNDWIVLLHGVHGEFRGFDDIKKGTAMMKKTEKGILEGLDFVIWKNNILKEIFDLLGRYGAKHCPGLNLDLLIDRVNGLQKTIRVCDHDEWGICRDPKIGVYYHYPQKVLTV